MKEVRLELDIDKYNVTLTRNGFQWNSVLYGDTKENSLIIAKAFESIGFKLKIKYMDVKNG